LDEARARHAAGDLRGAAEACRDLLKQNPDHPEALHLLGVALAQAGLHETALPYLTRALARGVPSAALLYDYGMTVRALGQTAEAARAFALAVQADSHDADAWFAHGTTRLMLGQHADAVAALETATRLAPARAEAFNNLGLALAALDRPAAAATAFQAALARKPDYIEARLQLGIAQQRRGQLAAARATFHEAVQQAPEDARGFAHLGNVYRDLGRFKEAGALFARARALAPDDPEVIANMALCLQHQGELAEAIEAYGWAIELAPDNEPLRSNRAQAMLLAGHFREGWAEFEHRLSDPALAQTLANLPGRRWSGEDLAGRSLLLRCEQGLGDAIQFARYVPLLARMGARVSLMGPARLARLFAGLEGLAAYIADDTAPPAADYHAPLLSLPHLLRRHDIPAEVPYLTADSTLAESWRHLLGDDGRRRIGLAWQGNPSYAMDYLRSLPIERMAELVDGIDARFVALQRGEGVPAGCEDLGAGLDADGAFVDTAAVMASLDLVITSDTATAHLAGALGVRTWVLLPFAPDWRWRLECTHSAWYPGMQLFRQPAPGDWAGVVARVRAMLKRGA
jgi:Flp pilus assembly protein TadD